MSNIRFQRIVWFEFVLCGGRTMSIWRIVGGARLDGGVRVQGAKNAVLPIMAASILTGCETELLNCPDLSDVSASVNILRHLGCAVQRDGDVVNIDSKGLNGCHIPHELMLEMRSSVIFLGAVLGRCGEAILSSPGGCELGPRPIDLHLDALRALGADITEHGGNIICRSGGLRGADINLLLPSVGATENAMIAACAAEGETVITNAAREPEIVDLQRYLCSMGAGITGAGTSVITVSGFQPRERVGHRVMPDRIAASTILCAAAGTGGDVELRAVEPADFSTVTEILGNMGCEITERGQTIRLRSNGKLRAPRPVVTRPYPGFPTDAQPLLMAACLRADGTTVFVENIFENRYRHVSELCRLGADIRTEGRVAMVTGVRSLAGAPVSATDLRGGAALVTAALAAEGETRVFDSGHISRGYEDLDVQLRALGGDIVRE
jgi:UDP-N-acetylglucosamine 1-carboxyvinyltransferase